jgi:hypothetical protein
MSPDKQEYLFREYAKFFPQAVDRIPSKTCMAFGFAVGDGWFELIETLLHEIGLLNKMFPIHFMGFQVAQVKEKFGGLRFYWHGDLVDPVLTDEVWRMVNNAEQKSCSICEDCGAKGKVRNDRPWVRTLCKKCSVLDLDPKHKEKLREKMHKDYLEHRRLWESRGEPPI